MTKHGSAAAAALAAAVIASHGIETKQMTVPNPMRVWDDLNMKLPKAKKRKRVPGRV